MRKTLKFFQSTSALLSSLLISLVIFTLAISDKLPKVGCNGYDSSGFCDGPVFSSSGKAIFLLGVLAGIVAFVCIIAKFVGSNSRKTL